MLGKKLPIRNTVYNSAIFNETKCNGSSYVLTAARGSFSKRIINVFPLHELNFHLRALLRNPFIKRCLIKTYFSYTLQIFP